MSRIALTAYVFTCDAPGCDTDTGEITPTSSSDPCRSAWRIAAREGWTRHDGTYCCPTHTRRPSSIRP